MSGMQRPYLATPQIYRSLASVHLRLCQSERFGMRSAPSCRGSPRLRNKFAVSLQLMIQVQVHLGRSSCPKWHSAPVANSLLSMSRQCCRCRVKHERWLGVRTLDNVLWPEHLHTPLHISLTKASEAVIG